MGLASSACLPARCDSSSASLELLQGPAPVKVPRTAAGLCRLGIIADVQYADSADGKDYSGRHTRYYRNTLNVLNSAIETWNRHDVDAVVQLGDLIDGRCRQGGKEGSRAALQSILSAFEKSTARRRFDVVGNHDLYNFPREELMASELSSFASADGEARTSYGAAELGQHWTLLFLDCFELGLIGLPEDHPNYLKAVEIIRAHNEQALYSQDWADGVPDEKKRYSPLNGAASQEQLAWLRSALSAAQKAKRKVLVFTHVPLYVPATTPKTVAWNADEVLAILHSFRDSVIAVLAGHDHCGGYAVDPAGLHHVTVCSPLHVVPPGTQCCMTVECYDDGWAHLTTYGYACAESGRHWEGRRYADLTLAKGADNQPEGA